MTQSLLTVRILQVLRVLLNALEVMQLLLRRVGRLHISNYLLHVLSEQSSYLVALQHRVILLHSQWEVQRPSARTFEEDPLWIVLAWLVLNMQHFLHETRVL